MSIDGDKKLLMSLKRKVPIEFFELGEKTIAKDEQAQSSCNFTFLTYNIDGLNPVQLEYRINIIVAILISYRPDIIHLQEVVPQVVSVLLLTLLENGYVCSDNARFFELGHYFTLTFAKTSLKSIQFERIAFEAESSQSRQNRNILKCRFTHEGRSFCTYNLHLESCGTAFKSSESFIRQSQLKEVIDHLFRNREIGIIAGDLNIRESEMKAVLSSAKSQKLVDVGCMIEGKEKFPTWYMPGKDTVHFRYDRILTSMDHLEVKLYELVGCDDVVEEISEKLPYYTPSDHRGIVVNFKVKNAVISQETKRKVLSEVVDLT